MDPIRHHLTVDVEAYFHASALEPYVPRARWGELESRVPRATDRLLELMSRHGVQGTFFVLGLVAREHPDLVRRIADGGHEVGSHGWDHRRVGELDREAFRGQARRSRELLEDLTGAPVTGFRAPTFSITRGREWALEVLVEEGYRYDSSLYPVRRPGYGYAGGRRDIHVLEFEAGSLWEVPPLILPLLGVNLPVGGGGSLRHLPYRMTGAALRRAERRREPGTIYLHPWELDPEQPRVSGAPWLTRLRHYGGLTRVAPRLERLLGEFSFGPIRESLVARREGRLARDPGMPSTGGRARTPRDS